MKIQLYLITLLSVSLIAQTQSKITQSIKKKQPIGQPNQFYQQPPQNGSMNRSLMVMPGMGGMNPMQQMSGMPGMNPMQQMNGMPGMGGMNPMQMQNMNQMQGMGPMQNNWAWGQTPTAPTRRKPSITHRIK